MDDLLKCRIVFPAPAAHKKPAQATPWDKDVNIIISLSLWERARVRETVEGRNSSFLCN